MRFQFEEALCYKFPILKACCSVSVELQCAIRTVESNILVLRHEKGAIRDFQRLFYIEELEEGVGSSVVEASHTDTADFSLSSQNSGFHNNPVKNLPTAAHVHRGCKLLRCTPRSL